MYTKTFSILALAGIAQSHMSMFYPPPLGGAPSINKQSTGQIDSEFNYPLGCCGSDGPTKPSPGLCRGHLDKFDTEEASVTWQPGQDAYFQLTDYAYDSSAPGSTHFGGSCQVGFSVDRGETWKVAASYHGACPHATEDGSPEAQTFDFRVPNGIPSGDALFTWVWLNREHEAYVSCSKVRISGSGNSSSPSEPSLPSTPSQPASPQEPEDEPSAPQQPPQQPDDEEEEPAAPFPPGPTGQPSLPEDGPVVTVTRTIQTTEFGSAPTSVPSDSEESDDTEESDSSDDNQWGWWRHRPHRKVQEGARRYKIEGNRCECRRDERTLAARCSCDAPHEKRSDIERMALRKHRRTFYKRIDACNWDSAPAMEVSYYTSDAKCAPNAKLNVPESDDFELKWDVSCGVVEGESEYQLKTMNCGMYGA